MEGGNQDMDKPSKRKYQQNGKRANDMRFDNQWHGNHCFRLRIQLQY
jgi:hypothetical protein